MRTGQLRDAVPRELRFVEILNALAIDMDIKFIGQMRQPLDSDSLASMPLVQERGDNGDPRLSLHLSPQLAASPRFLYRAYNQPASRQEWMEPASGFTRIRGNY